MKSDYLYDFDRELEFSTIYKLIGEEFMTLRQVEKIIGLSRSTIWRRINSMKYCRRRQYFRIRKVLDYNKECRSKRKDSWDEIDQDWKEYILDESSL